MCNNATWAIQHTTAAPGLATAQAAKGTKCKQGHPRKNDMKGQEAPRRRGSMRWATKLARALSPQVQEAL